MNLKDVQNTFHKELDPLYGKEEVDNFFFMLSDAFYKVSRLDLALNIKYAIDNYDAIDKALQLLKDEQPIQYILGETEFCGYPFKVNASTLIPRPETEELVEWIVKQQTSINKQQLHILDIGTGSGCIAISLAKKLPEAKVYALDISEKALTMSRQNAELNNVNVEFIEANILKSDTWSSNLENLKFDIIVSDVVMPNMDGPAMAKQARAKYPDLPVLFMSGYAEEQLRKSIDLDNVAFLPKPFSVAQIAEAVGNILAEHAK